MNREFLDRWCERGILGLVLAIMVFAPLATGAVGPLEFLIVQGLTMGVMLLWGLRLWVGERPRLLWPPMCWVVILLAGYAIYRYLTCDIEYAGRQELIRILVYTFLFLAVLNNAHRQESVQIISMTSIVVALVMSFVAVWQYLSRMNKVPSLGAFIESLIFSHKTWFFPRAYADRASGTYINPNHLAGFLEMLLPLALALLVAGRGRPLKKVFLGYAALVLVAGIGVTVSRGSWAATAGALLIFFGVLALYRSYRVPSLILMIVVVGASSYFITRTPLFKDRFRQTVVAGRLNLDMRADLWDATMEMWRDHKWFGVGPGHYDYRFRAYRPLGVQLRPDRAHNEYLNILADWGIIGAALVTAALAALAAGVVKSWKHVRRAEAEFGTNFSNKFAFVLGASFGLLALLLHSIVDFNMQIPANAILAILLAALLTSHLRFATESYWVRAGWWLKGLLSLVLLAGLGYLGRQEARLAREYVWLERAATKPNFSRQKIEALELAYGAEPMNFETAFAIAESYRVQSSEGGDEYEGHPGYRTLAQKAMVWFERSMRCNPFHGYNYLYYGWCLDWLGRHAEAEPYYNRAEELDPNGYYTLANVGRHYVEMENFAAARPWFERSLKLQRKDNDIAANYLAICNRKLLEAATNSSPLRLR